MLELQTQSTIKACDLAKKNAKGKKFKYRKSKQENVTINTNNNSLDKRMEKL